MTLDNAIRTFVIAMARERSTLGPEFSSAKVHADKAALRVLAAALRPAESAESHDPAPIVPTHLQAREIAPRGRA